MEQDELSRNVYTSRSVTELEKRLFQTAKIYSQVLISSFHDAAARGNSQVIEEMLTEDPYNLFLLDNGQNTCLHWAAGAGHHLLVHYLVDFADKLGKKSEFLNKQNAIGDTALHRSVWRNQAEIVKILLQYGIDTQVKNKDMKLAVDLVRNNFIGCLLQNSFADVSFDYSDDDDDDDGSEFDGEDDDDEEDEENKELYGVVNEGAKGELNLSDTEYSSEDEDTGELLVQQRMKSLFIPPTSDNNADSNNTDSNANDNTIQSSNDIENNENKEDSGKVTSDVNTEDDQKCNIKLEDNEDLPPLSDDEE